MRTTLLLLFSLCFAGLLQAQVSYSVNLAEAGCLQAKLIEAGNLNKINDLTISGNIDVRDFVTMKIMMPSLTSIDMTKARILSFVGKDGKTSTYHADEIPNYAFFECSRLTQVKLPDSLVSIGNNAFNWCVSLQIVTLPNSLKLIGSRAFFACMRLSEVAIPNSVTSIANGAFCNCSAFINVAEDNRIYSSQEGVLFNKNKTELIQCPISKSKILIPKFVTAIGDYAFYNCGRFTSLKIPKSVVQIGNEAFWNCNNLTSISLPKSLKTIGHGALGNCNSLYVVSIPKSVNTISDYMFVGCTRLIQVKIPNSVDSIGECAFDGCSFLRNAKIPKSVSVIGSGAFANCESLDFISIPESVKSIGDSAFICSTGLVNVNKKNPNYSSVKGMLFNKDQTMLYYGPSIRRPLYVPKSVTHIDGQAFHKCMGFIVVDKDNPNYSSDNGILYDKKKTTLIVSSTSTKGPVVIPGSVNRIEDKAFFMCTGISSVVIPNSVTSIGDITFLWCYNLRDVTLSDSLKSIGNLAFNSCHNLTKINIPHSVTSIGGQAFGACPNLKRVSLPYSVNFIGDKAFSNCIALTSVTVHSVTPPPINLSVFIQVNKSICSLRVPAGTKAAYANAEGWKTFTQIEEFKPFSISE